MIPAHFPLIYCISSPGKCTCPGFCSIRQLFSFSAHLKLTIDNWGPGNGDSDAADSIDKKSVWHLKVDNALVRRIAKIRRCYFRYNIQTQTGAMDRFVLFYRGIIQNYTENKVILWKQEDIFLQNLWQ